LPGRSPFTVHRSAAGGRRAAGDWYKKSTKNSFIYRHAILLILRTEDAELALRR
jgi:hypothetical protein